MPALSTIAAVGGLAATAIGSGLQFEGASAAAKASQEGIQAQQKAEALRMQAMELDASRKRREMVRMGIVAQGNAVATASNQGALFSSGLEGSKASITEQTAFNLQGVNQNLEIGRNLFGANQDLLKAKSAESSAQATTALGGGIAGLGKSLATNVSSIDRVAGWGSAAIDRYLTG
jgi:hypothetical protein